MSELFCLLNAFIGALCISVCKKKKICECACVTGRYLILKKPWLNLLYSVTFACEGITCKRAHHMAQSDQTLDLRRTEHLSNTFQGANTCTRRKTSKDTVHLKISPQSCLLNTIPRSCHVQLPAHTKPSCRWLGCRLCKCN